MEFCEISDIFARDMQGKYCIEISFSVEACEKYQNCWMGKNGAEEKQYWFGLTPDGNEAYRYKTFDEMATAKVFDGKSLKEICNLITINEIIG
jgi:hypothetical protein